MRVSRESHLVTLINVFETTLEQQQALIDHWIHFVEAVKGETGLIEAALHRSTDGTRVINYAQWRSEADWASFVQQYHEQFAPRAQLALRVDPHLYEVVYLFDQAGDAS
jgi:heme-degrading monooxygenase HmoA